MARTRFQDGWDPMVKQYLDEIGTYELLDGPGEVELAKIIEEGEKPANPWFEPAPVPGVPNWRKRSRPGRMPKPSSFRPTCGWWSQSPSATPPRDSPSSISYKMAISD